MKTQDQSPKQVHCLQGSCLDLHTSPSHNVHLHCCRPATSALCNRLLSAAGTTEPTDDAKLAVDCISVGCILTSATALYLGFSICDCISAPPGMSPELPNWAGGASGPPPEGSAEELQSPFGEVARTRCTSPPGNQHACDSGIWSVVLQYL